LSDRRKYLLIISLFLVCALAQNCRAKKKAALASEPASTHSVDDEVKFGHYFVSGCAERLKGNLQDALKLFLECEKMQPANSPVKYELAMLYKLLGQNTEAVEKASFAAAAEPRNEWYQLLLIDCYRKTMQYGLAVRVREGLVRNYPERSDFREDLAIDYAMTGAYDKSLRLYNDLEKTFGISEQLTLNKVKLLKSMGKRKEAEAELQKLIATQPGENQFKNYLAEFYMETGQVEKGKAQYDKILTSEPENPSANLALYEYETEKGNRAIAFGHLKKAFTNPDLEIAVKISLCGEFYRRAVQGSAEDKKMGIELAELLLKAHPLAAEPCAMYADFLLLDKRSAEAFGYYARALRADPQNYRHWQNAMFSAGNAGLNDSVINISREAMDLFPAQSESYLNNGLSLMKRNDFSAAVKSLRDGLALVETGSDKKAEYLQALGEAYYRTGDYDHAFQMFDELLKSDPDNASVLNNYAWFLALSNRDLPLAEKLAEKAIKLKPGDKNNMDTYGWVLYKQKRYGAAEPWLKKALESEPENPMLLEHYGDLLFRLGKKKEAVQLWREAEKSRQNDLSLKLKIESEDLKDE
jgi:tetratricopeptide (TPR) repeat protein